MLLQSLLGAWVWEAPPWAHWLQRRSQNVADNAYVGRAVTGDSVSWLPAHAGHYSLRAVDDSGAADSRDVDIEVAP